jgi:hypothetical protein
MAVLLASLIGIYLACNRYSFDERWIEELRHRATDPEPGRPWPLLPVLSAIATALVPIAVLAWGIRGRRSLLLDLGILLSAASLVTLRAYVHLAPLWVVLAGSGTLLTGISLAISRALRRAPGGELLGFTAEPLFTSDRAQLALQAIASAAALAPREAPAASGADSNRFSGGGGSGGGAGASDRF